MHDDADSRTATERSARRASQYDRLVDVALLGGALLSFGLLIAIARTLLLYIACGLFFMAVAAYTVTVPLLAARLSPCTDHDVSAVLRHRWQLVQGQMAKGRTKRYAWFVCTGAVLFLFSYWALQVVFRPPKVKVTPGTARAKANPALTTLGLNHCSLLGLSQTSIGCGGVKFVNADGKPLDNLAGEDLRTEL